MWSLTSSLWATTSTPPSSTSSLAATGLRASEVVADGKMVLSDAEAGEGEFVINIVPSRDKWSTWSDHVGASPAVFHDASGTTGPAGSRASPIASPIATSASTKRETERRTRGRRTLVSNTQLPSLSSSVSLGPCAVVYLSTRSSMPARSRSFVQQQLFWGQPGVASALTRSSWGRDTLTRADVDFYDLALADGHLRDWSNITAIRDRIYSQPSIQGVLSRRAYKRVVAILPGDAYLATAFMPGTFAAVRGEAIHWSVVTHELMHTLGVGNAGGLDASGNFDQYKDDAIGGYERPARPSELNAPARYLLGWLDDSQASYYPHEQQATLRALNEGPLRDGAKLVSPRLQEPAPLEPALATAPEI